MISMHLAMPVEIIRIRKIYAKYKSASSKFTYSVIFRSILASAMHYLTITFDPSRPSGEKRAASEYYPEVSITNHSITRRKRKVRAARIHGYIRPQYFRSPLVAAVQVLLHLCASDTRIHFHCGSQSNIPRAVLRGRQRRNREPRRDQPALSLSPSLHR